MGDRRIVLSGRGIGREPALERRVSDVLSTKIAAFGKTSADQSGISLIVVRAPSITNIDRDRIAEICFEDVCGLTDFAYKR